MQVVIKNKPSRRLAVLQHRGSPSKMGESVAKLMAWAKAQRANLQPGPGDAFGFAYDDPKTTAEKDFRHDLAITIPENLKLDSVVSEKICKRHIKDSLP